MLREQLPRWDSIFGPIICGLAWGLFAGLALWTVVKPEHHSVISNRISIERFCLCISVMGCVGLVAGVFADRKLRSDERRIKLLAKNWKLWAASMLIFAVLNAFWLPAVQ